MRVRAFASAIIAAGALLLADAAVTLVWEEPVTHLFTLRQQAVLDGRLETLRAAPATGDAAPGARPAARRPRSASRSWPARSTAAPSPGSAIGEIRLPRIDERFVIVKGSDPADLRKGPGTYDGVGLPGVPGTAAIAGHRTTYGAPFRDLDELRPGDRVTVAMPYATFTYRVERTRIVEPDDLSVLTRRTLRPAGAERLPPALQRGQADRRARAAGAHGARGRRRLTRPARGVEALGRVSKRAGGPQGARAGRPMETHAAPTPIRCPPRDPTSPAPVPTAASSSSSCA